MAAGPPPPGAAAGGDPRVGDAHRRAVAEAGGPSLAAGSGTEGAEVAAEVDHGVLEPLGEAVGEPALADAAEVDGGAGAEAGPALPHLEHLVEWRHRDRGGRRPPPGAPPNRGAGAGLSRGDEGGRPRRGGPA